LSEHPTRYAAALVAAQRGTDPVRILTSWGVPETTSMHVVSGLGVIHLMKDAVPTQRGQAFAELFVSLGFDAETWATTPPSTADDLGTRVSAALRLLLLESATVALVTRVLQEDEAKPKNMARLVELADKTDPMLTRMAIGSRTKTGEWQIYPQARFE